MDTKPIIFSFYHADVEMETQSK